MFNKEKVQHIAKLARIGLSPKEVEKFRKELSLILDYVEKLKEVDISKAKPTTHSTEIKNVLREDKKEEKLKTKREELLKLAPKTQNNYLKVKPVRNL